MKEGGHEDLKIMKPEEMKQAVQEFKEIYFLEYGVKLSDYEATEQAKNLLNLFDTLSRKELN